MASAPPEFVVAAASQLYERPQRPPRKPDTCPPHVDTRTRVARQPVVGVEQGAGPGGEGRVARGEVVLELTGGAAGEKTVFRGDRGARFRPVYQYKIQEGERVAARLDTTHQRPRQCVSTAGEPPLTPIPLKMLPRPTDGGGEREVGRGGLEAGGRGRVSLYNSPFRTHAEFRLYTNNTAPQIPSSTG